MENDEGNPLSQKGEVELQLLTSPKYHCEFAGEGVEFWLVEFFYQSLTIDKKRTKEAFEKCVRSIIKYVKKHQVISFGAICRRYIMAYNNNNNNNNKDSLTFKIIKRFVKITKTHCNITDQDKAFVEKAWREAELESSETWQRTEVMMMGVFLTRKCSQNNYDKYK